MNDTGHSIASESQDQVSYSNWTIQKKITEHLTTLPYNYTFYTVYYLYTCIYTYTHGEK